MANLIFEASGARGRNIRHGHVPQVPDGPAVRQNGLLRMRRTAQAIKSGGGLSLHRCGKDLNVLGGR